MADILTGAINNTITERFPDIILYAPRPDKSDYRLIIGQMWRGYVKYGPASLEFHSFHRLETYTLYYVDNDLEDKLLNLVQYTIIDKNHLWS